MYHLPTGLIHQSVMGGQTVDRDMISMWQHVYASETIITSINPHHWSVLLVGIYAT